MGHPVSASWIAPVASILFATQTMGVSAMDRIPISLDVRDADYRTAVEELLFAINTLHDAGLDLDEIPDDLMAIYYADFILLELIEAGVGHFRKFQMPLHRLTERDVLSALERIGAVKHRQFFADNILGTRGGIFGFGNTASKADRMLTELGQSENIEELISALLKSTDQIEWVEDAEVNSRLAELTMGQIIRTNEDKED